MDWKKEFALGKELVLATCSKPCNPHANIVISCGFYGNKLLIADCQMDTTIKNLVRTKKICIVGGYLRLKGTVIIVKSGKIYDFCQKKTKEYKVKNAILVTTKDVFDLNNMKKVF